MSKTTVLFLCRDNALLGPLAEAYFNRQGGGLVRSFSAGVDPVDELDSNVTRLLCARGMSVDGLGPKSFEVFTMAHAPLPDRLIVLDGCFLPELPKPWQGEVPVHNWCVAAGVGYPRSYSAAAEYFRRIRNAVDRVLEPGPRETYPSTRVA
ncbi:low molecular weight phosphatase family protein [Roseibium limicola]|uniref:arsenate-mycothiol transferase ArsC n=1 Tax=Roseibium TaxID=150830 RepID=UPI001AD94A09